MPSPSDLIRLHLASGPANARQLIDLIGVSQPTLSRALTAMGSEVVRIGAVRSIQYALRDSRRGLGDVSVYRVDASGRLQTLGTLVPVCPQGWVMQQADGQMLHSDGLPWWLQDMRPQGFLGRAYVANHAQALGLPTRLGEWDDSHVLRALLTQHDTVGNLLLGDAAREQFLSAAAPTAIPLEDKGAAYAQLAQAAARGEQPGSSAGGEQPKFTAYAQTAAGAVHVLVKFTLPDANPLTERWRDLLLAEHHALETLRAAGVEAARSWVLDHGGQRFLEVERFDRVGALGRRGVLSLASVEAEFVGNASAPWPVLTAQLAALRHITPQAAERAALLYAYGTLIANTDMHHGNLAFVNEQGRPYALAPAYDMLPMAFAPRASGSLPSDLPALTLRASVLGAVWVRALGLASDWHARLQAETRWSAGFAPCLDRLGEHLAAARGQIERLG